MRRGPYINNVDDARHEYYRVFAKKIKPMPPEPHLSNFYYPQKTQKNCELLFVRVGTSIARYALNNKEKLYQEYYQPDRLWTGGKTITELHKITFISRKDIRSCLAKQVL